jgi:hypothetical protein
VFDVFTAAAQAREQEFGQGGHDEKEDLSEPPRFVFSVRQTKFLDFEA